MEMVSFDNRCQSRPLPGNPRINRMELLRENRLYISAEDPIGLHRSVRDGVVMSCPSAKPEPLVGSQPFCCSGPRTAAAAVVRGDPASDGGVAGSTDRGGISVECGSGLPGDQP